MIARESLRDIAGRYGTGKSNIDRHRIHVKEAIARNVEAQELVRTGTLLEDVRAGEGRTEWLCEKAEQIVADALEVKDTRTAIQAIRAAGAVRGERRSYLELRGELTNELGRDRTSTAISIQIISPAAPGELPRVSFQHQNALEAPEVSQMAEIGVIQQPG